MCRRSVRTILHPEQDLYLIRLLLHSAAAWHTDRHRPIRATGSLVAEGSMTTLFSLCGLKSIIKNTEFYMQCACAHCSQYNYDLTYLHLYSHLIFDSQVLGLGSQVLGNIAQHSTHGRSLWRQGSFTNQTGRTNKKYADLTMYPVEPVRSC